VIVAYGVEGTVSLLHMEWKEQCDCCMWNGRKSVTVACGVEGSVLLLHIE